MSTVDNAQGSCTVPTAIILLQLRNVMQVGGQSTKKVLGFVPGEECLLYYSGCNTIRFGSSMTAWSVWV